MLRVFYSLLFFFLSLGAWSQQSADWAKLRGAINFYMCNDMGRNGYYEQKPIAELMGRMAEVVGPECVFAVGDVHHFYGVASVSDPLWNTNFEHIYAHPELMIPWYPVLGNHEYRGNSQAVLDYAQVSRRWMMPARYYFKTFEKDGVSVRVVMLDTAPLIDKYRKDSQTYPDVCSQVMETQLQWLDRTLSEATEDWVLVLGHHPIYAETGKSDVERLDMQRRVDAILRRHKVDVYACGHIHNFQHLRVVGSSIDYIVNSAASLSRKVNALPQTEYCSGEPGFSIISVDKQNLNFHFVDKAGKVLHTVQRSK